MQNLGPLSLPLGSNQVNHRNERKVNTFSLTYVCEGCCNSFIFDRGSQKNLISAEVAKWFNLPMTPHLHPYNIRWLLQGRDIRVSQQCHLPYDIDPFKDEALCDISPLEVYDVLLGQPYLRK
jgi:hypothetical protein